jgi:hypothetical protein
VTLIDVYKGHLELVVDSNNSATIGSTNDAADGTLTKGCIVAVVGAKVKEIDNIMKVWPIYCGSYPCIAITNP